MSGPKAISVELKAEERQELAKFVNRHPVGQQLALRGRIILRADEGQSNSQISRELGVSKEISPRHAGRLLKRRGNQVRYWLTPNENEYREEKISDINTLYQAAPALDEQGEKAICNDEMTGVQARKHPNLPVKPGQVEKREFEYIRHGTHSFMVNFEVATGRKARSPMAQPEMKPIKWLILNGRLPPSRRYINGISC